MKIYSTLLMLCSLIMLLTYSSNAQDVYSYRDTLRIAPKLSSGYWDKITSMHYYIYTDVDQAIAGTYLADGALTLKAGSGNVDSLFVAEWPIPSTSTENIYYISVRMVYDGEVQKLETDTFKIGPLSVVMADTLGGYGYINEDTVDGAGQVIGPIYLPGDIPADGGNILVYYAGTSTLAGINTIDGSGLFKVWVDAEGVYDIQVSYPGFRSGKRTGAVPTVP